MVKTRLVYVCSHCGAETPKWQGKCFNCGRFGTLEQKEVKVVAKAALGQKAKSSTASRLLSEIKLAAAQRISSGFLEIDRVLGGGLVPGSVILLAGSPGLGKSTLLLQLCSQIRSSLPALYISAEESVSQVKLRARRLAVKEDKILVLAENDVDVIASTIESLASKVSVVIVDSIQAVSISGIESFSGSITQVRESGHRLSAVCKELSLPVVFVGHVTKSGAIAGPKSLEHLVDVVLFMEGSEQSRIRILRSLKNRFGDVFEVGFFRLESNGFCEIENPSERMIEGRKEQVPGSVVAVVLDGARPLVLEVQALTAPNVYGNPLRNVTGISHKRLLMLLAVLQRRAGLNFSRHNVFVNVSGGIRVFEPGIDLAVCVALGSSLKNQVVDEKLAAFGEVGLLGEIRAVSQQEQRVKTARKLGFNKILSSKEVINIKQALKFAGL